MKRIFALLVASAMIMNAAVITTAYSRVLEHGEELDAGFGFVMNNGKQMVFVSAERNDGSTFIFEVEPGGTAILPKNTVSVSAFPGDLSEKTSEINVSVGKQDPHGGTKFYKAIEKPGGKTRIPETEAIPADLEFNKEADIQIPEEAYEPGESPLAEEKEKKSLEQKREQEQKDTDKYGDRSLRKLNDDYMRHEERLVEIDPAGEEAGAIREALPKIEQLIRERIEEEKAKYGDDWLERYRDPVTGKLPGGFLSYERILKEKTLPGETGEIKGRVFFRKNQADMSGMQKVYTVGNALVLGDYMEQPFYAGPAADFNVLWYVMYCEVTDKTLFEKFKKLLKIRTDINERLKLGDRKISKEEFEACKELMQIKDKVMSSCKWKAGSLPAWRTKTDGDGKFSFILDKVPGEENVIYLVLQFAAFPPEGKVTSFQFENQSPGIGVVEYPLFGQRPRFLPESAIPSDFVRAYPDEEELRLKLSGEREALKNAENELEILKEKSGKRPGNIEGSWKERALKEQRAISERYEKENGSSKGWTTELRKKFELELADVPEISRRSWEKDMAEWNENKNEYLVKAEEAVKTARKNVEDSERKLSQVKDMKELWEKALEERIGEIDLLLPEAFVGMTDSIFEFGGDVSGKTITPEVRTGYDNMVYLVKQTIDDDIRNEPIAARYSGNGNSSVSANLNDPDSPRPPFVFNFEEPIGNHLVINVFRDTFRGSNSFGVYGVFTVFDGLIVPDILPGRLNGYFIPLPATVEVEGYPIKNSKKFHEKIDDLTDKYDDITDKYGKQFNELAKERIAGKLDLAGAGIKFMEITDNWRRETQDIMKEITEVTKDNPAFKK